MRILITGGTGLLAETIFPMMKQEGVSILLAGRNLIDITDYEQVKRAFREFNPDITLHLAAYTDVAKAEYEKKECYKTNVIGTSNIARFAKHLIYISTEYVFDGQKGNYFESDVPNPVNYYSLTKLLGESEARRAKRYTIIRTLFKPRPFEHKYVCEDMWTSGDYVDVIAKEIVFAVQHAKDLPKVLHIGTGKKNLLDLAKRTRKDVVPMRRSSLPIRVPRDTSLNTKVWEKFKHEHTK